MKILGISCGHDANVCIVDDQKIIVHLEKERFTRVKRDVGIVDELVVLALEVAGIKLHEIDLVASSIPVWPKYGRTGVILSGEVYKDIFSYSRHNLLLMGEEFPAIFVPHHVGHMAYAYYLSGFSEADIISVDGWGNFTATAFGVGEGSQLSVLENLHPSNIGALWCVVSKLIFGNIFDAGKLMGLSSYGKPIYFEDLCNRYIKYYKGYPTLECPWVEQNNFPYLSSLEDYTDYRNSVVQNIAASVQEVTNHLMVEYTSLLKKRSGKNSLCLTGGVALNGVSNNVVSKAGYYENVFIGPATNDSGLSIGFALYAKHHVFGKPLVQYDECVYLSKPYSYLEVQESIYKYLNQINVQELCEEELIDTATNLLLDGNLIAWFQGRAESGPRALGHRSILGDPRYHTHKKFLNTKIKQRENFRPFAATILKEFQSEFLDLDSSSPYMLKVVDVKPEYRSIISAVTHIDGTTRPQSLSKTSNYLYYNLIQRFYEKTQIPLLLNTSFNIREPIVESPIDAINCFVNSKLDYLFINNFLLTKCSDLQC